MVKILKYPYFQFHDQEPPLSILIGRVLVSLYQPSIMIFFLQILKLSSVLTSWQGKWSKFLKYLSLFPILSLLMMTSSINFDWKGIGQEPSGAQIVCVSDIEPVADWRDGPPVTWQWPTEINYITRFWQAPDSIMVFVGHLRLFPLAKQILGRGDLPISKKRSLLVPSSVRHAERAHQC